METTRFVVRFKSRRDATLFHNEIQKQLKRERSYDGFTECEYVHHWKEEGGLLLTVSFKDPKTLQEVEGFSFGYETEWKLLPPCYMFNDLLKLEWEKENIN